MTNRDSEVLYSKKSWLLGNDPMTRANVTSGVFRNCDQHTEYCDDCGHYYGDDGCPEHGLLSDENE